MASTSPATSLRRGPLLLTTHTYAITITVHRLCRMVAVAEFVQSIASRYATCENRMDPMAMPAMDRSDRPSCSTPLSRLGDVAKAMPRNSQHAVSSLTHANHSGSTP